MDKLTRKNIVSAIITIIILSIGLLIFKKFTSMKTSTVSNTSQVKERRKVTVSTFTPSEEKNIIDIDGRLYAHERVNISSKVSGLIQNGSASVKNGQYFRKGDLLFSIDSRELGYTIKAQKSTLQSTITQMMPDIKFDFPDAYEGWLSYLNNFNVEEPIKALPEPKSNQEKYFVSGKNVNSLYFNIKSQEAKLADHKIYAPFSGSVTEVNTYPGALINPGTSLATMINTSYYELETPVPLENLQYIKVGQTVKLISTDLNKTWSGKVSRIGTQIDPNTQNIPLYIKVSGTDLKDGMYLKGELEGASLKDVVKLPKNIFLNPKTVYLVKDSTLFAKEIIPIKRADDFVIVKGIELGEMIVTGSLAGLFQGQKVTY